MVRLRVVTTHLSFLPTSNGAQLRLLVRRLAERSGRLVLMGDLNMGPRRADRLTGLGALATGPTFPADAPTRQIDHILGRGVDRRAVDPSLSVSTRARITDLRWWPRCWRPERSEANGTAPDPAGMHGGVGRFVGT